MARANRITCHGNHEIRGKLLKTLPDFYWPHVWLAIGYAELGEMDKANAAADQVRELYPKWPIEAKSQFELNWNSGPLPLIRNIDRLHRLAEF